MCLCAFVCAYSAYCRRNIAKMNDVSYICNIVYFPQHFYRALCDSVMFSGTITLSLNFHRLAIGVECPSYANITWSPCSHRKFTKSHPFCRHRGFVYKCWYVSLRNLIIYFGIYNISSQDWEYSSLWCWAWRMWRH